MTAPAEWSDRLREPFPASEVGQLPRAGTSLSFVGHAAVTSRLLQVDPSWNWEPLASTEDGLPLFDVDPQGRPVGFWIRLTVCGVTRLGYGSCPPNQFDAVKVLVGDALRNAAMRFGVALDLWVKGSPELPQEQEPRPVYISGSTVASFLAKCAEHGLTPKDIDEVVMAATGRTPEPTEVYADELDWLRKAFDAFVTDREEKATALSVPPGEDKVAKKVPKRPLAESTGITDVPTGTLV